jgi:hypothetical protein
MFDHPFKVNLETQADRVRETGGKAEGWGLQGETGWHVSRGSIPPGRQRR